MLYTELMRSSRDLDVQYVLCSTRGSTGKESLEGKEAGSTPTLLGEGNQPSSPCNREKVVLSTQRIQHRERLDEKMCYR